LDHAGKIQAISDARHRPQSAPLDLDELVRRLHSVVAMLHEDVRQQHRDLSEIYHYQPDRRERVALEIDTIAREMDASVPERKIDASTLKTLLSARAETTDGQAVDRYCYRVAYFAMTRILLARVWEDIGFIDQVLYDGGFAHWYAYFNAEIQRVLRQAFHFANERYTWLYGAENNYTWYTPSETVLVDVLYDFSRFDFRALDADVLGAVYEAYLDEVDRKNKGQYYTPRPVVQFIWDRVGFDHPSRILRFAEGSRQPRVVADFCTGSGGFLVEAARRIREAVLGADFDPADPNALARVSADDLSLAMRAIIEGLRGAEVNAFAYYLTEVNLLIQLTPIIAAIQKKVPHARRFGRDFALAVLHQDALKLHNRQQPTLNDNSHHRVPEFAREDEVYKEDRRHDIVSFSGFKRIVYDWLKNEREMDYVCSNPPYVGEKGHKELFRYYRNNFEYWDEYYQGKMDYLYWFIILGLSKLRDGGRLGYITTSYWPTASGAKTLRRYILSHAKIIEMIDFGETRIFSDAPGQHNLIVVLERCDDEAERAAHRPLLVEIKQAFQKGSLEQQLNRLLDHIQAHTGIASAQAFKDEYLNVFHSPVTQGELSEKAWTITYGKTAGTVLQQMENTGANLSKVLEINAGVHSNADTVKQVDLSRLRPDEGQGLTEGVGIFILTQEEREALHLPPEEQDVVKPTYKNSDITPYLVDPETSLFMLYVDNDFDPQRYPTVMRHLNRFKPILKSRLERYGETYPWYRLHRPHQRCHYDAEKLVAPRWGKRIEFAYEGGGRYENSDINLFIRCDHTKENIKYFLALLNAKPLDFWREHKGQFKGVSRQALLKSMPIRRIRFDPPTDEATKRAMLNDLKISLDADDAHLVYDLLHQSLNAGQQDVVHDGLVILVDQIIALKTDMVGYNRYFDTRLTRLEDDEPLPEINPLAMLQDMDSAEQWSIAIHIQNGTLSVEEAIAGSRDDFYFYRIKKVTDTHITLRAKGRGADTLTLKGDAALIIYLSRVLPAQQEQFWREVKQTLVPKDMTAYTKERRRLIQNVTAIRDQVTDRQSVIDRIVLDLYGITDPEMRETVLKTAERLET
jgi:hypothetical protein